MNGNDEMRVKKVNLTAMFLDISLARGYNVVIDGFHGVVSNDACPKGNVTGTIHIVMIGFIGATVRNTVQP